MSDREDEAIHLRNDVNDFHAFQAPKRAKSISTSTWPMYPTVGLYLYFSMRSQDDVEVKRRGSKDDHIRHFCLSGNHWDTFNGKAKRTSFPVSMFLPFETPAAAATVGVRVAATTVTCEAATSHTGIMRKTEEPE